MSIGEMVSILNEKIFIAIAAFKEEDLLNTIKSIYKEAEKPEDVYVGICNQRLDDNFEDFSSFPNVRTANLTLPYGLGLGLAWLIASWLMQDEYYVMRVDGHMRFKKDWDKKLKYYHNLISETYCYKIIISGRTPWFEKKHEGVETYHSDDPYPWSMWAESTAVYANDKFKNKIDNFINTINTDPWNRKRVCRNTFCIWTLYF